QLHIALLRRGGEGVSRRWRELGEGADQRILDMARAGGDDRDSRIRRIEVVGRVDDAEGRGKEEGIPGLTVELEIDLGAQQASRVAGADDDVLHADRLYPLLQRADRNVGSVIRRFLAGLEPQAVAVRAVRFENERPNAAARMLHVVGVDLAEDFQPVRALEAGEPERAVETAVAR